MPTFGKGKTVKIKRSLHPEICCSNDLSRETINDPYLDGDKLISTNGHLLVVLPVEVEEGDVSGKVPKSCLSDARKKPLTKSILDAELSVDLKEKDYAKVNHSKNKFNREFSTEFETFPDWAGAISKDDPTEWIIILNPDLIMTAFWALGGNSKRNGIKLRIKAPVATYPGDMQCLGEVKATVGSGDDGYAVIMPMRRAE